MNKRTVAVQEQDRDWSRFGAGFAPAMMGEDERDYPVIQFHHNHGFEIPVANLPPGCTLPTEHEVGGKTYPITRQQIRHSKGRVDAYITEALNLVFVAQQPTAYWKLVTEGGRQQIVYAASDHPNPLQDGYKSRDRYLVVAFGQLFVLTVKSTTAGHVEGVVDDAKTFVQAASHIVAAKTGADVALPLHAFYVPVLVTGDEQTEQGGQVMVVGHAIPETPDEDTVWDLAVPDSTKDLIAAQAEPIQVWSQGRRGRSNGSNGPGLNTAPVLDPLSRTPPPNRPTARPTSRPGPARTPARGTAANGGDFLRVRVHLQQCPPHYAALNGQPFGDLLGSAAGQAFVAYLASEHTPAHQGEEKLVQHARSLMTLRAAQAEVAAAKPAAV